MVIIYFSILFHHLYQIYTFSNNLNSERIKTSRLMCELHYQTAFSFFVMKISENYFREKINNRKTFTKHVTRQNHFVITKFTVLISLISSLRYTCHWGADFCGSKCFFSAESAIQCWQSHRLLFWLLQKHELRLGSSHWNYSVKKEVLKNVLEFHRNALVLKSLFNRVAGL